MRVGDVGVEFEGFGEGVVGFVLGLVVQLLVGVGFGRGREDGWRTCLGVSHEVEDGA
jgi:hypothetical protein